jgi:cytochrome P450
VEIVAEMQRFTVAAIARVLFSTDVSESETSRLAAIVRDGTLLIRRRNTSVAMWPMWMPTADNRRLRAYRRELDAIIERHIAARKSVNGASESPDLLGALMQARDSETGAALRHDELLDETKTLMVAGFETTATALAWALYLLARHGDVAAQWHAELDRELGGRTPQPRDLERLPLTAQIVHETMRLYPSVYNMSRQCVRDDELNGCEISKGTIVLISISGIHRAPAWGEDADSFRPQRFASGAWPKRAFLPFGAGKHLCIGNSLAILEMMLALASIGQRFRLHADDSAPVEPRAQITLVPSRPIPIRLEARA